MRKLPVIFCLLLLHCSAPRPLADNPVISRSHPQPVKIFQIGYWPPDRMVLILIDANHQYFNLIVKRDDRLQLGDTFVVK